MDSGKKHSKMNALNSNNDLILSLFPQELQRNIEALFLNSVGLSWKTTKISFQEYQIGRANEPTFMGKCHLNVPYAGTELKWEITFNPSKYCDSPEVEFIDDDFLDDPDIDVITNNIPSLANWDVEKSKSLLGTVQEFLVLYKKEQLSCLANEKKFQSHFNNYQLLLENTDFTEDDIEVFTNSSNCSVHFLIDLKIDPTAIPHYVQPCLQPDSKETKMVNPGKDVALLSVIYYSTRTTTNLILSPRLEQHLSVKAPSFNKKLTLAEYVKGVKKLINVEIDDLREAFVAKQEFINTLLLLQEDSVLFYDNIEFRHMELLLGVDDHMCVVSLNLDKFPAQAPVVTLRSIYVDDGGKPAEYSAIDKFYNIKKSTRQKVEDTLRFLKKEIVSFKDLCQL